MKEGIFFPPFYFLQKKKKKKFVMLIFLFLFIKKKKKKIKKKKIPPFRFNFIIDIFFQKNSFFEKVIFSICFILLVFFKKW
jgi:hypothetical protein